MSEAKIKKQDGTKDVGDSNFDGYMQRSSPSDPDSIAITEYDLHPDLSTTVYKTENYINRRVAASGYLDVDQTIATSTYTKVEFDTQHFDTHDCFDLSNHRFTAKYSAIYYASASVRFRDLTAGDIVQVVVYKNGSAYRRLTQKEIPTTDPFSIHSNNGTLVELKRGEYLEFFVFQNKGSSVDIQGSSLITYFDIFLYNLV